METLWPLSLSLELYPLYWLMVLWGIPDVHPPQLYRCSTHLTSITAVIVRMGVVCKSQQKCLREIESELEQPSKFLHPNVSAFKRLLIIIIIIMLFHWQRSHDPSEDTDKWHVIFQTNLMQKIKITSGCVFCIMETKADFSVTYPSNILTNPSKKNGSRSCDLHVCEMWDWGAHWKSRQGKGLFADRVRAAVLKWTSHSLVASCTGCGPNGTAKRREDKTPVRY